MFDRSFRLYIFGLAIAFPFFNRLSDFFYFLLRKNHRFVFFISALFLFNIVLFIIFFLRKEKHTEFLPFVSAIFILYCAFSLHKLFLIHQNLNNRQGFFHSYLKNLRNQFFKQVNLFSFSVHRAEKNIIYQRSLGNFPARLMREYEKRRENESVYNQEILNLNEERKQLQQTFTGFTDKYNLFIRNSQLITNELAAIDISLERLKNDFTRLNSAVRSITCYELPIFNIPDTHLANTYSNTNSINLTNSNNPTTIASNYNGSLLTNNIQNNSRAFKITNYLFFFQLIFLIEILIAFSTFLYEMKEKNVLDLIRTTLFFCTLFNTLLMIYLLLFTQITDQQCLMRNISECKELDSSYDQLNNLIFPNSNRLGSENDIEKEFKRLSAQQKNTINKITTYVNLIIKNKIGELMISFTELFKKLIYIEKDFIRLMDNKVDKEAYYFLLKEMNSNLEQIKIFNRSIENHNLLPLLDRFYQSMTFFDVEQNNINTYISKNIVGERGISVNEGCRIYLDRICRSGDMLDKVYFTLLVFNPITGILFLI